MSENIYMLIVQNMAMSYFLSFHIMLYCLFCCYATLFSAIFFVIWILPIIWADYSYCTREIELMFSVPDQLTVQERLNWYLM